MALEAFGLPGTTFTGSVGGSEFPERDGSAFPEPTSDRGVREIVDIDELGFVLRLPLDSGVLEVSDELLLLRVDGDERRTVFEGDLRLRVDVLELRIAVGMLLAFDGLFRRLKAVAQLLEQLADGLVADADAVAVDKFARRRSRR